MPNQPKTPNHSIRSPSEIWGAAEAKARRQGLTMTDVINRYLKQYASRP